MVHLSAKKSSEWPWCTLVLRRATVYLRFFCAGYGVGRAAESYRQPVLRALEHDQDPSEVGDDCFTLDGTYFIRFLKLPPVLDSSINVPAAAVAGVPVTVNGLSTQMEYRVTSSLNGYVAVSG